MKNVRSNFLGMQFYQGEAVQLWAVEDPNDREKCTVYLYQADGERERIMKGLTGDFLSSCDGFLDREGNLYCFQRTGSTFVIVKTAPDSSRIYRYVEDRDIMLDDICQLEDGRIFLTYSSPNSGSVSAYRTPAELDTETGGLTDAAGFRYGFTSLGTGGSGLLCVDSEGIHRIDVDSGTQESIWSFQGTTYVLPSNSSDMSLQLWDFRMNEDGCPEFLFGGRTGEGSFVETLQKAEVKDREVVIMQSLSYDQDFTEIVDLFNRQSSDTYIALESCGLYYGNWDDYTRLTSIEVAAGKGPDIFYGDVLGDYAWEIAQKGGLEDLAPYLAESGMEDDCFPCAFGRWRNGDAIYTISPFISLENYYMNADIFGGDPDPDIEVLTDSLLAWQGDGIYRQELDSLGVLEALLKGTEDIWGAVDWEAGTCDFGGSLFARILEVAKRYGNAPNRNDPELTEMDYYNIYLHKDKAVREEEGLAVVETLFDDGWHALAYRFNNLSVNTNSAHKDNVWEFLSFLLSDEVQRAGTSWIVYPVKKVVFDSWMKTEQTTGYGTTTGMSNPDFFKREGFHYLTDERVAELRDMLEGARFLPIRTKPILDIIYEEAQGYFAGQRSIDEVTYNIENRVQLYLNENR